MGGALYSYVDILLILTTAKLVSTDFNFQGFSTSLTTIIPANISGYAVHLHVYHVRVELALQKPLITHKPRMVQKIDCSTNASKGFGRSWLQTPGNQVSECSPYTSTSATAMFTMHKRNSSWLSHDFVAWHYIGSRLVTLSLSFIMTFEHDEWRVLTQK